MKKFPFLFLLFIFFTANVLAQLPNCSTNPTIIYFQSGNTIRNYDVTLPTSPTNPSLNTISMPPGGAGLAVGNNLFGPGPSPTFYTNVGSNWWYHDGTNWVNSGHLTAGGSISAVNSGGGGNYLYALIGGSGDVWRYDGSGNSIFLLTVPGFQGGGPYDLQGDCDGGFYILRTNTTGVGPFMRKYDSNGLLVNTWPVTGSSGNAGGGFAIMNSTVYYYNGGGFRSGPFVAAPSPIAFTLNPNTLPAPSDMASCRVCDSLLSIPPPPPIASFDMSNDTICSGDLVNFTDMSIDTPTVWNWTFPTATPATSNAQNPMNIIFNTPGLHTITLIASNAGGSDTATKDLFVYPKPVASISGDTMICSGQSATLTASPSSGVTYLWGNNETSASITMSPLATTVYNLVVDNGQCLDTAQFTVTVINQPVASITGPTEICFGESANLSATPSGVSYAWSTNELTQVITPSPTVSTTYTVVTANGMCIDSASHTVDVNPLPMVTLNPSLTNCDVENGTIAAQVTSGTPGYTYAWSNQQTGQTATGLSVGNYSVLVTDSKNCTATGSNSVGIRPNPVAVVTPYPIGSVRIGESLQLNASGGTQYNWTPSTFLNCSDCSDPITSPDIEEIIYCVEVKDLYGCTDTACTTVLIDTSCSNIFVPNAFTPNGDGLNDNITIRNTCSIKKLNFVIFNRWGQKVFETDNVMNSWNGTFEGEDQPISTFFYVLEAELINGRTVRQRGDITLLR